MKRLTQEDKPLKHKEEAVMQILWKLRKAFVKEIVKEMKEHTPYNTVSSIVRKLQKEGYIGYEDFGKTHRYFPLIEKETYRKSSFQRFVDNYFGGSPEQVLPYFVKEENIKPNELNELLERIKKQ